ncbi:hypothetical protein JTB14_030574 [Gonioctena quinquepunctata]|nr:hypothetical protein JTB14_030574 [Gonioctena quinquepunctata]
MEWDPLCEHHPKYRKAIDDVEKVSPFLMQDELQWGKSYRHFKRKEKKNKQVNPAKAPIDVPFELCRARQRRKRKRKYKEHKPDTQKLKKISLLEKSIMSQSKYMEYLSIPNPKFEEPPIKKAKRHPPCQLEPCPPRLVQLAVPNKRRVFENWKDYHKLLPTEMILRYEQILHTEKNLEPRDARYYYKKIDKRKKARARAKKRSLKKKKKAKEKGDKLWLEIQIKDTVDTIMDFIKNEPLFALNYKQVMLSDEILNNLDKSNILKKPKRKSKNSYKRTIVEVCDKMALWMDTLTKFVDVQAVDSKEDIPPLTISSLGEMEGEEESEGESEEESFKSREGKELSTTPEGKETTVTPEGEDTTVTAEGEGTLATPEGVSSTEEFYEGFPPKKYWGYGEDEEGYDSDYEKGPGEKGPGEKGPREKGRGEKGRGVKGAEFDPLGELLDNLNDLKDNADILDELIEMYEKSPEDFLMSEVDKMPGVTHMDILNKLRELKGDLVDKIPKRSSLEDAMLDWARDVAPDKVDDKVIKAIHEFANALGDKLRPLREKEDERKKGADELGDKGVEMKPPKEDEDEEDVGEDKVRDEDELPLDELKDDEGRPLEDLGDKEKKSPEEVEDKEVKSPEELGDEGEKPPLDEGLLPDEFGEEKGKLPEDEMKFEEEGGEEGEGEDGEKGYPWEMEGEGEDESEYKPDRSVSVTPSETEGQLTPETEGQLTPETEGQLTPETEGQLTPETEGQLTPETEGQLTPETEGQLTPETEGQLTPETEMWRKGTDAIGDRYEGISGEGEEEYQGPDTWEDGVSYPVSRESEGDEKKATPIEGEVPSKEGVLPVEGVVLPKDKIPPVVPEKEVQKTEERVIKGHRPSVVVEHSPNTVCCLSLKVWAAWLLEIAHNAHTWTEWMHEVIKQVREFAAIVRGDVMLPNGEKKILYKKDWKAFTKDTEEKINAWQRYSVHKKVNCCPKCLQDNLIKDVVTAHETFQALTEAMNYAGYWQSCLDNLVQKASALTGLDEPEMTSEESEGVQDLEELELIGEDSDDSIYEIEELDPSEF